MKTTRPWRYSTAMTVPESHFFAMQIRCESCGSSFWFSEHEQKHWYEELGFWIESVPKACAVCRRAQRARH